MRREEGGVGLIFGGGVAAEGFGHYFCFSKEESDGENCEELCRVAAVRTPDGDLRFELLSLNYHSHVTKNLFHLNLNMSNAI